MCWGQVRQLIPSLSKSLLFKTINLFSALHPSSPTHTDFPRTDCLPTLTSYTSLLAHSLGVLQVLWADSELRFGTVSRMGPRELSTSSVLPCCAQPDTSAAELPSALGAWNCGCATVLQTRLLLITPLSGADDWGDVAGSLFSGRKWNWESVHCTNTADCPALREDPLNYTSLVDMRQATSCVASFI